jgi:hypothetical protein
LAVNTHLVTAETLAYATVVKTDIAAGRARKESDILLTMGVASAKRHVI